MESKALAVAARLERRSPRKELWYETSAGPAGERDGLTTMRLNVCIIWDVR